MRCRKRLSLQKRHQVSTFVKTGRIMTPQVLSEPQQCTAALKWTMECSSVKGWLLGGVIVTASICALFYIFGSKNQILK